MKNCFLAAAIALGLSVSASASDLIVSTPFNQHHFSDCEVQAAASYRAGTGHILIADCATRTSAPQVAGWQPMEHPDGGILLWQSQVRVDAFGNVFSQCTFGHMHIETSYAHATIECLDDPFRHARR